MESPNKKRQLVGTALIPVGIRAVPPLFRAPLVRICDAVVRRIHLHGSGAGSRFHHGRDDFVDLGGSGRDAVGDLLLDFVVLDVVLRAPL